MLNGKTAVVTGASRGIGAAVARKLAALGVHIDTMTDEQIEYMKSWQE